MLTMSGQSLYSITPVVSQFLKLLASSSLFPLFHQWLHSISSFHKFLNFAPVQGIRNFEAWNMVRRKDEQKQCRKIDISFSLCSFSTQGKNSNNLGSRRTFYRSALINHHNNEGIWGRNALFRSKNSSRMRLRGKMKPSRGKRHCAWTQEVSLEK